MCGLERVTSDCGLVRSLLRRWGKEIERLQKQGFCAFFPGSESREKICSAMLFVRVTKFECTDPQSSDGTSSDLKNHSRASFSLS